MSYLRFVCVAALPLEQSFGNAGLSDAYSPWDSVDHFGRAQIKEILKPRGTSDESGPQVNLLEENAPLQSFQVPKPGKRHSLPPDWLLVAVRIICTICTIVIWTSFVNTFSFVFYCFCFVLKQKSVSPE